MGLPQRKFPPKHAIKIKWGDKLIHLRVFPEGSSSGLTISPETSGSFINDCGRIRHKPVWHLSEYSAWAIVPQGSPGLNVTCRTLHGTYTPSQYRYRPQPSVQEEQPKAERLRFKVLVHCLLPMGLWETCIV